MQLNDYGRHNLGRVPDGMSWATIWWMRQSRKTLSITAGPISFGTATADRQARSSNRPPGRSTRLRKCQPRLADPIPLAGGAHLTFGLSGPLPVPRAARTPRIRFAHVAKYGFVAN